MPIIITNASELAQIGSSHSFPGNGSYILGNDIRITEPWRSLRFVDGITFDGNGHHIYTLDAPLFSAIINGAVRNLTLTLDEALAAPDVSGLVVDAVDTEFIGITTYGSISSVYNAAGIASYALRCSFIGCENYASVTIDAGEVGGIAAYAYECDIIDCINYADINGLRLDSEGGGVAGIFDASPPWGGHAPRTMRMDNCKNYGNISVGNYGGGITGSAQIGPYELIGCINYGDVSPCLEARVSYSATDHFGGVAGLLEKLPDSRGVAYGCANCGEISGALFVGGIAGSSFSCVVNNCESEGSVFGGSNVGGIVGFIEGASEVSCNRCCGIISAECDNAGGIVGFAERNPEDAPNLIIDNLAGNPSVSGRYSVHRVLGGEAQYADTEISGNIVSGEILLTGDNTGTGGLVYDYEPVFQNDPQLGDNRLQGATFVCPPGERFEGCLGCVPDGIKPPRPPCCCDPCRCRPCCCRPKFFCLKLPRICLQLLALKLLMGR